MNLSLCMIVKNEENHLDETLKNITDYVSDIVIVDTGSTDKTKEIARRYTDSIYDFEWCNDFSKARNFSISKAKHDWILVLDADEVVTKLDTENIVKFINKNDKIVGRVKRINPFEQGDEIRKFIERVNRLFNKNYFEYEGIIHEQIVSKNGDDYKAEPVEIELDHVGYMAEVVGMTSKLERNIELLKMAIKDNPGDPYLYYQIAKSYYKKKEYEKAYVNFKKAIEFNPDIRLDYVVDLVESYGYALLKYEKYSEALELKKYSKYYGQSPDYNFVMGLIYMNNALFEEAISSFKKSISDVEGKIEGVNSYLPNYNIGVIYEVLGYADMAKKYYKQCGNYERAKERLKHA